MKMKKLYIFAAVLCAAAACGSPQQEVEPEVETVCEEVSYPLGFCPDSLESVAGKVKKGQFFANLLSDLGMSAKEAYDLTQACAEVFDVKSLRVGNAYTAYYGVPAPPAASASAPSTPVSALSHGASSRHCDASPSHSDASSSRHCASSRHCDASPLRHCEEGGARRGNLLYLVYERDRSSSIVFNCTAPYGASIYEKPVTVESRYADVTISTSLWNDMLAQGVSPLLILSLSDIYAWTIDFFGLQKGDRFQVLYEEKICDGEVMEIANVRYAVFTHAGQTLPMVMFDQGDGGNMWWNEKGESMRKAFLKAPLKYSRISSGFSYARRHPVTRRVQPHTGVDYAAPAGTPVMTIGDGTVTSVKYEGAGGKTIRIRHNSVYSTAYLHLSKYAKGLKAGQRVRQGEIIGYVGSTGRSTGPHLDFRVWKNGSPINPLKMDSPPAEPLKEENREAFDAAHMSYRAQIDTIAAGYVAETVFKVL